MEGFQNENERAAGDVVAPKPGPWVFISAAEPSADLLGAALIREARRRRPDLRFVGVAGPKMVEAGCWSIFDFTRHAAMLLSAVKLVGSAYRMTRTVERCWDRHPFEAAVLIDSPTLHLPLARKAKKRGIPVLYYVAPQLWAWGAWRMNKLRRRVDRVAAILPFEEAFFREHGVPATFVGHPLFDELDRRVVNSARVQDIRAKGSPVITLLPGSRKHVVKRTLPGQLEVASRVARVHPQARFGVSMANDRVRPVVRDQLQALAAREPSIAAGFSTFTDDRAEWIQAADLVLVASGTTTLEVAYYQKPMIVMYNASRVMYHLVGRWVLRTKYLSLPNILAGRELVPEFMPYYSSVEPIAETALNLLEDEERRRRLGEELLFLIAPMRGRNASEHVTRLLLGLFEEDQASKPSLSY